MPLGLCCVEKQRSHLIVTFPRFSGTSAVSAKHKSGMQVLLHRSPQLTEDRFFFFCLVLVGPCAFGSQWQAGAVWLVGVWQELKLERLMSGLPGVAG